MGIACVTGASRGIGRAIAMALATRGWTVCAVARTFNTPFESELIIPFTCDLTDVDQLRNTCEKVLAVGPIDLLINNAGIGRFGPHETLADVDLAAMTTLNLLAPMLMTKHLLRSLRETAGCIVNVASTSGLEAKRFGCAYAATKAGLIHFGHGLFEEVRKQGLRVVTISPDMTRTDFHDAADFEPSDDDACALTTDAVVSAVLYAIDQPANVAVNDVVVRPQKIGIKRKQVNPRFHRE